MSRIWTFIKLYFIIFMFTEPGTWFRWICILAAVLVSAMPSTTVFRGFAVRLQAYIDGLVPPPAGRPVRQHIEGQGGNGGAAAGGAATNSGINRQGEPDPAATAARLLQEHRQRHPNVLRDTFERVERGFALFVASLIPGVGERHVRAREEVMREMERVEREERDRIVAREEDEKRRVEEEKKKEKESESVPGEVTEASGDVERKGRAGEASSPPAGADRKEEEKTLAEEPLVDN
jgi:hypothetical protein